MCQTDVMLQKKSTTYTEERPIKQCDDTTVILPYSSESFDLDWFCHLVLVQRSKQHCLFCFVPCFMKNAFSCFGHNGLCLYLKWNNKIVILSVFRLFLQCEHFIVNCKYCCTKFFAFHQEITWLQSEKIKISISRCLVFVWQVMYHE